MNKTEILAPCGNVTSVMGAIAAGADAVYIGGSKFSARAFADNAVEDELLSAIDFVHLNGKKIYLTVNTLLKNEELYGELFSFLTKYYERGLDAVIVQDIGVLGFLRDNFPEMPLHASTQMTIASSEGIRLFDRFPTVTRFVPSRELSLSELRRIRSNTKLEMECFVHGALCYSFSGQCLFSSMIGGRSGNRGRCAQPCRKEYDLLEGDKTQAHGYLLSLKDICTLDSIPDLIEAGIDSFKIEGRMKKPEYTAGVVAQYAYLTDLYSRLGHDAYNQYLHDNPEELSDRIQQAKELYNRGGFTKGYYFNYHGKDMMAYMRPNHTGVPVGKVCAYNGSRVSIKLSEEIHPQDILEIRGSNSYEFTVGKEVPDKYPGLYETNVLRGTLLSKGDEVFRTRNAHILDSIDESYFKKKSKGAVEGYIKACEGRPLELKVSYLGITAEAFGNCPSHAQNRPVSEEDLRRILMKTGEADFDFADIRIEADPELFIPVGDIKEIRRNAFALLKQKLTDSYCRSTPHCNSQEKEITAEPCETDFAVKVSTYEQLEAALSFDEVQNIYLDIRTASLAEQGALAQKISDTSRKVYLCLPHVFREKQLERYTKEADFDRFDGVVPSSWDGLMYCLKLRKEGYDIEIRPSSFIYVFNDEALSILNKELGLQHVTVSEELNLRETLGLSPASFDLRVYGRSMLMCTAQCLLNNFMHCRKSEITLGKDGASQKYIYIKDKMGERFPVRNICKECVNEIYNSHILSLIGTEELSRINTQRRELFFSFEDGEETKRVINAYLSDTLLDKELYTRGHIKRGVE